MVVLELRLEELMLKEYSLKDGDRLTIGRHPEKDIAPKDAAFSKQHAVIERVVEKLIVLDRESRNGTFVNGMEVQSAELNDEDIFRFGNQLNLKVFAFSLKKMASEAHADKSAVHSTIERTLDKL
jgi:pSer/pThr/pTyr-binding forkhead associated (FHA) protein